MKILDNQEKPRQVATLGLPVSPIECYIKITLHVKVVFVFPFAQDGGKCLRHQKRGQ